ncbi:MAG: DEAD/DEAH box helicase [Silvanigrellaceae bacterium]|nr:DEAD/DEAH box helicase [Silvanigrellaceae bacterium]
MEQKKIKKSQPTQASSENKAPALKKSLSSSASSSVKKSEATLQMKSSELTTKQPKTKSQPKQAKPKTLAAVKAIEKTPVENELYKEELIQLKVDTNHLAMKYTEVVEKIEEKEIASLEKAPEYIQVISSQELAKPKFESIVASAEILKSLFDAGWTTPNVFLQKVLPAALRGSDIALYTDEQNSGHELISILPSLTKLLSGMGGFRGKPYSPCCIIALQRDEDIASFTQLANKIAAPLGVYCLGVSSMEENHERLKNPIDILVSTPIHLKELLAQKTINFTSLKVFAVYDLNHELRKNGELFLNQLLSDSHADKVQKIFISKRNTPEVREMCFKHLDNPEYFTFLESNHLKSISHEAYALPSHKKFRVLLAHLNNHKPQLALVFANTKTVAEWIAFKLHSNNIRVELLSYEPSYTKKQELLQNIAEGKVNVVVTTDILAQSLGLKTLTHLYHFDIPEVPELYLERLKRIEGAKSAFTLALICEDYGYNMKAVEQLLDAQAQLTEPPSSWLLFDDHSPYPLEPNGRVKQFVSYATLQAKPKEEDNKKPIQKEDTITVSSPSPVHAKPQEKPALPEQNFIPLKPRSHEQKNQNATNIKESFPHKNHTHQAEFKQKHKPDEKQRLHFSEKHVRRDEKAIDLVQSLRNAAKSAQEKQQHTERESSHIPKSASVFKLASNVVSDVIQNTTQAAKETFVVSFEKNFPKAADLLNKILPGLGKKNKDS